uniref:Proteoglycan 4a n=1 Tax=Salmo trutta TaxID=8032 RepID=A0A674AR23_SALTR
FKNPNDPKTSQNPNTLADVAKALGLNDPYTPITLADIATALGLSDPSTLADVAKALGVNSPNDPKKPSNRNTLADIAKALGLNDPNKPITLADIAKALGLKDPSTTAEITKSLGYNNPNTGLPDADSNPDLCSDLPINGLTTLANGTILIFKGHFFWTMDPITKDHGPARNITEELGIPSPIDSAFTRTNCQGKSYIIKGDDYWGMDNGNMEPGYPKSVASGFHGLTGTITAALPVPATRRRPESVYFFKKGGTMQKYSYHAGSSTVCGKKSKSSTKKRHTRQTEMSLGAEINIKLALKGFPSSVTSAVSVPSPKKADGYDYFLFAGRKSMTILTVIALTPVSIGSRNLHQTSFIRDTDIKMVSKSSSDSGEVDKGPNCPKYPFKGLF